MPTVKKVTPTEWFFAKIHTFCFLHFRKPLGQLRSAIDHIMMLHTKLVEVGGLHPDSEDELNLPISSADKRAAWKSSRSMSVTTRSRNNSTSSVMSSHPVCKVCMNGKCTTVEKKGRKKRTKNAKAQDILH